jgi:uncharacterized membrane protein
MKPLIVAAAFLGGIIAGAAMVVQINMTSHAVARVVAQGPAQYSDADRRALRSVIRSELKRAKRD